NHSFPFPPQRNGTRWPRSCRSLTQLFVRTAARPRRSRTTAIKDDFLERLLSPGTWWPPERQAVRQGPPDPYLHSQRLGLRTEVAGGWLATRNERGPDLRYGLRSINWWFPPATPSQDYGGIDNARRELRQSPARLAPLAQSGRHA